MTSLRADPARLRAHVAAIVGERHPKSSPAELDAAQRYIADRFSEAGLGVEHHDFTFHGRHYQNVVGTIQPHDLTAPRVLLGAHFDSVRGTPGADDNASGVAALLETARLLGGVEHQAAVEFVGFNLEEPQGATYRVGSRAYANDARRRGVKYRAVYILEMVGYTDDAHGSQQVPALLFWKRVPKTGTFLAATGHRKSTRLLRTFAAAARTAVPQLDVVTFLTPFNGWIVPHTRLSDNASFWDVGYPALMITDTAFLRNPHYHRATDDIGTLDFDFMAQVTTAVAAAVMQHASPHR